MIDKFLFVASNLLLSILIPCPIMTMVKYIVFSLVFPAMVITIYLLGMKIELYVKKLIPSRKINPGYTEVLRGEIDAFAREHSSHRKYDILINDYCDMVMYGEDVISLKSCSINRMKTNLSYELSKLRNKATTFVVLYGIVLSTISFAVAYVEYSFIDGLIICICWYVIMMINFRLMISMLQL